VPSLGGERGAGERGGYEEDRGRGGRLSDRDMPSRADEVDNWGSTKKFVPAAPAGAGGDGYNDRRSSGRYGCGGCGEWWLLGFARERGARWGAAGVWEGRQFESGRWHNVAVSEGCVVGDLGGRM
jgi:hypothetical protein